MATLLKCPDCGHTKQSDDGEPETCPQCEGTMTAPAKKKPKIRAGDEKPKKKSAPRDEGAEPRPKKKAAALSLDDESDTDGEDSATGPVCDGKAAASLELDPGFKSRRLMKQVKLQLSRGEVLHWAGRMCPEIAERKAFWTRLGGIGLTAVGGVFCAIAFSVAPWFVGLIPLVFVAVGLGMAILGPGVIRRQVENGWYAVTNRRAIVYEASAFGSGGHATTYEPHELRRMWVKPAKSPKGAGDLIFKTVITETQTDYVDRKTGRTVKSETSRSETHYGFLGIESVNEVETLIHNVLLGAEDD
jgi:hypothetical protein